MAKIILNFRPKMRRRSWRGCTKLLDQAEKFQPRPM